ncbi:VanZ family protein [Bosea sp. PAMC 26642]|uniref:VanZ family protein n=1 Tax=Bosea sp. (strain PAMC 26642) TaxID=1792307 RepID=UPI000AEAB9DB|nr:VanZ family protein [Bosea sp. PAMC 26642]
MLDLVRVLSRWVFWILLALIVFATLSSIENRPHVPYLGANADRFAGFFALTAACGLAYPRRLGWLALGLIVMALGLEFGQTLVSSRHGRAMDAMVKIAGVVIALIIVTAGNKIEEKWLRTPRLG